MKRGGNLLERITSAVLLLVMVAVVWMLLATYHPAVGESATQLQVILILVLLTVALILVSVVALLHTR
jgi:hypothetical protein